MLHTFGIAGKHRPMTSPLEDGTYDAFVVWAERRADAIALECVITAGMHRGATVDIVSRSLRVHDVLALVGVPCTLTVRGDAIAVDFA